MNSNSGIFGLKDSPLVGEQAFLVSSIFGFEPKAGTFRTRNIFVQHVPGSGCNYKTIIRHEDVYNYDGLGTFPPSVKCHNADAEKVFVPLPGMGETISRAVELARGGNETPVVFFQTRPYVCKLENGFPVFKPSLSTWL